MQKTKDGLETALIVLIVATCSIYGFMIVRELVRNTRKTLMARFYATALKSAPKHELEPVRKAHAVHDGHAVHGKHDVHDGHAGHDAHDDHGHGGPELFEVFNTRFLFGYVCFISGLVRVELVFTLLCQF